MTAPMTAPELERLAGQVMPAINAVEQRCSQVVASMIAAHPDQHVINATDEEWSGSQDAFGARDAFYATMMPAEADAIRVLHAAYERLKTIGWREAIYCPKDGSRFDVIEAGSTGIHDCAYLGEWPSGMWLIDGDYPSRPILYRPTEAELAQQEGRRLALKSHLEGKQHD